MLCVNSIIIYCLQYNSVDAKQSEVESAYHKVKIDIEQNARKIEDIERKIEDEQMQRDESRGERELLMKKEMKLLERQVVLDKKHMELLKLLEEKKQKPPSARVVEIGSSVCISAKAKSSNSTPFCLTKPISIYWFGLEVLKTLELATQNLSVSDSAINITLDGSTYEIERNSLQDAMDAIKSACQICRDDTPGEEGRGFMSKSKVRNTEVAFSSLVTRALDRFIFPTVPTGACLHQAPVRTVHGNPERPDIYIVKFKPNFVPGHPVSCTDIKATKFDIADNETVLYNAVAVQEGGTLNRFPVLIGLPCTYSNLELQLHVSVDRKVWKLIVAERSPWDEALLCTLYATVHYLMENGMLNISKPLTIPEPFKDMKGYSICGVTNRVFLEKRSNVVFKFFDTDHRGDDFFNHSIMEQLIEKCPSILPEVKLTSIASRVYILTYKYIPGREGEPYDLKDFVGVVQTLICMHRHGFVHGDIRLANMVFTEDGTSHLIDFDFVGKHGMSDYFDHFNYQLDERHPEAFPGRKMKMEHDRHSLAYVIEKQCESLSTLSNLLDQLKDTTTALEHIITLM